MMKSITLGRCLAVILPLMIAPVAAQATTVDADAINISGISRNTVTRHVQVKVSDLNLAERAGQQTLAHRISYASKQVCDPSGLVGLDVRADYQRCRQGARAHAQREVARVALAQSQAPRQLSMR